MRIKPLLLERRQLLHVPALELRLRLEPERDQLHRPDLSHHKLLLSFPPPPPGPDSNSDPVAATSLTQPDSQRLCSVG
jgi:hypothetical protein